MSTAYVVAPDLWRERTVAYPASVRRRSMISASAADTNGPNSIAKREGPTLGASAPERTTAANGTVGGDSGGGGRPAGRPRATPLGGPPRRRAGRRGPG